MVASTDVSDIWFGSSGRLIPGIEAKVLRNEGIEITGLCQRGELLVKAPTVALDYLKNEQVTKETFVDLPEGRFMRTGDGVEFRKSSNGNEHLWVLDRIKKLIKVNVSLSSFQAIGITGRHSPCLRVCR